MFESRVVKTDVTAVKLINNFVLAGIGNFLHIFDLNGKFLKKLNVFDGQKIHGINLDDVTDTLLLYGGCYMQTITCNFLQCEFTKLHAKTVHGWVLTSRWLKSKWIAAVVMLNKLLIFDGQLNILREIVCAEKCILYSAFISYNDIDELVVLSGTVFGEIVIWKVNHFNIQESSPVVKRLTGHKGVIFSISYNEEAGYICSSSDDRSTILWSIENKSIHSELQRTHCNILLHRKIYGHQSRVFRSLLLQNLIVTAGEDSTVNVWDFEGQLIKKITHQGGPIWALDGNTDVVVSGGGDCGVLISSVQSNSLCNSLLLPENYNPKRIGLLRSSNLVVITEDGVLFYYARNLNMWIKIDQHKVLQSYNVLEVSKCKSLFSLSGYHGEIFIYQEQENSARLLVSFRTKLQSRIFSFFWLTCSSFFVCESKLSLWYLDGANVTFVTVFDLPRCKDIWISAACQGLHGKYIAGDRRGNIYIYKLGFAAPIFTYKKAHSYMGVTHLCNFDNDIVSLGRDGTVKTFTIENNSLVHKSSDKVPTSWLASVVGPFLLGFSGNVFVVWDYIKKRILFEHVCGGGHRSWDFNKLNNMISFAYVQNGIVKILNWDEHEVYSVVAGFHANTINSARILTTTDKNFIVLSGGEDTNLRISLFGSNYFLPAKSFKSHLSCIRCICLYELYKNRYLVFTGGGRGQIICWKFVLVDKPGDSLCSEECSFYEKFDGELFESEVRIMDLKTLTLGEDLLLFAAASDGNVNMFTVVKENTKYVLVPLIKLFYQNKCVTKLCLIDVFQSNVLGSFSTDGTLAFWDVTCIDTKLGICPFKILSLHHSGIADCCFKFVKENSFVLLTGGDDGSFVLTLFHISKSAADGLKFEKVFSFCDCHSHCAQVTGTQISSNYFITTSIDQKLLLFKWTVEKDKLVVKACGRYNSTVTDVQGVQYKEKDDYFNIFVYGEGLEFITYKKK